MIEVFLENPAATTRLGRILAAALPEDVRGWTFLLHGELGVGKSALARAFLHALGHEGPVPSPTYTLVEPYELPGLNVYHVDLYRIGDADELRYLGWNELDAGLRLVEWAERAPGLAAAADVDIRLEYKGVGRMASLRPLSSRGGAWLGGLSRDLEGAFAGAAPD